MSTYDYVQIVTDDNWGLVGIVAPGSSTDRTKLISTDSIVKIPTDSPQTYPIRPKPKIITQAVPQITPAREVKSSMPSQEEHKEIYNTEVFGNLSNFAHARPNNLLIGFGK